MKKNMTSAMIREMFLSYFEEKGHTRVKSHSLIPPADPTLLFVNAGMVQFKDVFSGERKLEFVRATSSQKCLRVSGKHNDLDNVGRTARHHTFFEMLGNFSFGDYFKKDAIAFAHEFLIHRLGLDPDRLYYTVFGGSEEDGMLPDTEAEELWKEIPGVNPERILRFGKKDNFWAMGDTGPCGPCSEILYDRGPGPWACGEPDCAPGCDCDRFMEIWNLVFMQFLRKTPGADLEPLPAPSIDTGMGLERLVSLLQEKPTNYETDLFMPFIEATQALLEGAGVHKPYGQDEETNVAYRVIADHARSAAFMVGDQVYPDNEGRGYIVRLIMRRAIRFGKMLGFNEPFLHRICLEVVEHMGAAYPELLQRRDLIDRVVLQEEQAFGRTFEDGRERLSREIEALSAAGSTQVPGQLVFWLYDERGFPPDLTAVIAEEHGFTIDRAGYEVAMNQKRAASGKEGSFTEGRDGPDLSGITPTRFLGYSQESTRALTLALFDKDKAGVEVLGAGANGIVVLDQTPLYGESGGQVGDQGTLSSPGLLVRILDTTRTSEGHFLHHVLVEQGELKKGLEVQIRTAHDRRLEISRHHSATHLLHQALFQVLGDHIKQEGSIVTPDFLRFDFRHFGALEAGETRRVEEWVRTRILGNTPVTTDVMTVDEAVSRGAKAFFGDKYGDRVRMVSMAGGDSIELCGGVHVTRTGDIGGFRITRQEAVSSGVRRIYAVAGLAAEAVGDRERETLRQAASLLRCGEEDLIERIRGLQEGQKRLEKELEQLQTRLLKAAGDRQAEVIDINGISIIIDLLKDQGKEAAAKAVDLLRDRYPESVVLVAASQDGTLQFVMGRRGDKASALHCGNLVKEMCQLAGSRGGGRPDFAQAGGAPSDSWDQLKKLFLSRVKDILG